MSPALIPQLPSNRGRFAIVDTFTGRRRLIVPALVAGAIGAWLGWPALVAAGIAPILIALAPCAVMCALGFCASGALKSQPKNSTESSLERSLLLDDAVVNRNPRSVDSHPFGCPHCEDIGRSSPHSERKDP